MPLRSEYQKLGLNAISCVDLNVVNFFDPNIGKLAWIPETGPNATNCVDLNVRHFFDLNIG